MPSQSIKINSRKRHSDLGSCGQAENHAGDKGRRSEERAAVLQGYPSKWTKSQLFAETNAAQSVKKRTFWLITKNMPTS